MVDFIAKVIAELDSASLSAVESKLKSLERTNINLQNVTVRNARFSQAALTALQNQLNNLTANIRIHINGGNGGNNPGQQIASNIQSSIDSISTTAIANLRSQLQFRGIDTGTIDRFLQSVGTQAQQANMDVAKLSATFKEFQHNGNTLQGLELSIAGVERTTGTAVNMVQRWDDSLQNIIYRSENIQQTFGNSTSQVNSQLSKLVAQFKEMSQIRIKLNGLDEGGKNSKEAAALKARYAELQVEMKKLVSTISSTPVSGLSNLGIAIDQAGNASSNTTDKFNDLRIALAQALGQSLSTSGLEDFNSKLMSIVTNVDRTESAVKDAANSISSDFSNTGASTQRITELQTAITSLGTYGAEAQQKLDGLKQTASNITSGGLNANEIVAEGAKAKQAFADVEAAVKRAMEAMRLDDSKTRFGQQLKDQLNGLTPETEQFRQRILAIQTQLQNADAITLAKLKGEFASITAEIKDTEAATKDVAVAQETLTKSNTLSNKIQDWMNRNTKAAKEYEAELKQLQDRLKNNTDPKALKQIGNEFNNIKSRAQAAGLTVSGFGKSLKDTILQVAGLSSAVMVFQKAVQTIKEMYQEVVKIDTAMTELYRVTNLSSSQYEKLYDSMVNSAKTYGTALSDIINSTASWVRLGFDAETSNKLAEITSMYQHVTDLDEETAVNNLVTAYKGFQKQLDQTFDGDEAEAIRRVADIYDKLGNEFAESAADVGQGMSKTASVLAVGGASIEESAALFTGINEVLQDAATSGTALKIITLRIRGMKGELEELGEEVGEDVDSISKIQTQILNITHGKVNIFDDSGNFRDIYDVLEDISKIYYDLTDPERAKLLEIMAGKNRANSLQALIDNWDQVAKAKEAALGAAGTAEQEQEIYMRSLQGQLDSLTASWQAFSADFLNSSFVSWCISALKSIVEGLDSLVNTIGALPTVLGAGGIALLIKNFGNVKLAHYGCESIAA